MRMRGGMVAYAVPALADGFHLFGVLFHPEAAKEERRFNVMLFERFKDEIRFVVLPC